MTTPLPHPHKTLVSLAEARAWSAGKFLIQRKMDGVLARREVGRAVLLGELVTARSGAFLTALDRAYIAKYGSFFAALTVESIGGKNILKYNTAARCWILSDLVYKFPPDVIIVPQRTVPEALTDEEGYVAHALDAPWGNMLCHKQASIYVCRVTSTGASQSVGICDAETGVDRGRLMLGGGACDRVRVGSIVRCEAMSEHEGGKLRQATKCREFLVKF